MSRFQTGRVALALALLAYAALAFGYATLTPIWQNPDEPAHYNYIAQVAETLTLPELRAGDWNTPLLDHLKSGQLAPADPAISGIRYEAWQPPLAYIVAAPVFRLGSPSDPIGQVVRLRLLDAVFGGATLILAYATAREVLPVYLASAVPVALAGVPMFTSVSASVSADPLANLLAAALVLCLVRWLGPGGRRGPKWAVVAGLLLGLGLLTKLAVGMFVPLALAVVLVRSTRAALNGALLLGTAGLLLLPWLLHQVTTYGWTDPLATARHAAVVLDQPRFPGVSPNYLADFLTITFHSFWAQFGWMSVRAGDRLYWFWGVISLVAAAGLLVYRRALGEPRWLLLVGCVLAAVVAYVGYNLQFEQFQGRYLFPAAAPLGVLLVAGWAAWFPARAQGAASLGLTLSLVAVNAWTLAPVLVPGFAPGGVG